MLCYPTIGGRSSIALKIKGSGKQLLSSSLFSCLLKSWPYFLIPFLQGRRICTGHRRVPPILATSLVLCRGLHYQLNEPAPKVQTEEGAVMSAALIGSRPPRCEGRCALCGRCEAVQVPVAPRDKGAAAGHFRLFRAFGDRVDESSTNYKPLNWKCRCADRRILNP